MQIYKAFLKIIYKNLNQLLIYVVIFLFFAIVLSNVNTTTASTSFSETKCKIAFINNDQDSVLVNDLKSYLGKNATIVNVSDDTQKLQDALFFRQVEYIVKVPPGFTKALLSGKDIQLQKTTVPGSTSSFYMDNLIDKYLNTARTYTDNLKNLSQTQLINYINKDLSQKTKVNVNNFGNHSSNADRSAYYFNYLAYSLFEILILGVCCVMIVFNDTDLKKRNLCSPIKSKNMHFQLILGNLSFALITWVVLIISSFIICGSYMVTANGLLMLLNSLVFTLACLSISYLLGNILKSRGAISAAANVVALGSSFISGVFVPQILLGKTVLSIASFTPTYWYVKANNDIVNIVNFKMENLTPIFSSMLIILGFAVAILAVTLVVAKQKRMNN
jgi:ABC-2 type transport system permease protein